MEIQNNYLMDSGNKVPFVPSPNKSSAGFTPRFIIIHYTAGRSAESSIRTLCNPQTQASAHFVIGRDGSVTQLVTTNEIAWHAGQSSWQGLVGMNRHSFGIELDNAGKLEKTSSGWRSWFGSIYPEDDVGEAVHQHGGRVAGWHLFPTPQIDAAVSVGQALANHYEIQDVLGHDDIAPGRKIDPGPLFPMDGYRSRVLGRKSEDFVLLKTIAEVNLRAGPGTQYDKSASSPLRVGTLLRMQSRESSWIFVEVLSDRKTPIETGWIMNQYAKAV